MRALVLGARGAVGRIVVRELERRGHEVTSAGRGERSDVRIDLATAGGLESLRSTMRTRDVVVNASGVEDPRLATVGPLVEISATSAYLQALAAVEAHGIVRGAGLAPGLSTILATRVAAAGDDVDLGIMLGSGERHGAAAVAWTAGLIGTDVHAPPEGRRVRNLRASRILAGPHGRRRYLRADFPDHVLVGPPTGARVRSHLAVTSRIATLALGAAGRFPALRGIVERAPHLGSDEWGIVARNRRTGQVAAASGYGQSVATGALAALAAERIVETGARGPVSFADIASEGEALERIAAARPA
ncbi:NAD-dependent epimerase/dehydratase family protein [Microbacterium karelineae]|uniref:NAD-dependent epimerase/dehydratase family protein n=1 Tax=Microbacterium karelineae TaxID=2654283 RepID=UPI0012E9F20A|nr:NAD-dependent epimerase/dehydratase family protein [Microbacterium karelineae]